MSDEQVQTNYNEARYKSRRLKRFLKWIAWTAIAAAAVYGLVWSARQGTRERLGEAFPNQGQEHVAVGSTHPAYNSNPPTSGWHYAQPANWGIYQNELPDENLVHNLEHGGIWISYTGVSTTTKEQIEALAKKYPNKMIVAPRSKNDSKIVLASWTRLLKLDNFDEATIVNFIKANKNRSPEPNAQ